MKTISAVAALAIVGLVACDAPTALNESAVTSPSFKVEKIIDDNNLFPVDFFTFHPCTDQLIHFTGTDHFIFKFWSNGHFKSHLQFNLNGEGVNDGLHYKLRDAINQEGGPGGLPFTFTVSSSVISQGPDDNFVLHQTFGLNENGDVTRNSFSAECRG